MWLPLSVLGNTSVHCHVHIKPIQIVLVMLPNDHQYVPLPLKQRMDSFGIYAGTTFTSWIFFVFKIKTVKTYITQMRRLYAFVASEPTHKKNGKEEAGPNCLWNRSVCARADKGWAVKRALRSLFNVWCGVALARALFPRFRCAWRNTAAKRNAHEHRI